MTQEARPKIDVSVGGWTPTPAASPGETDPLSKRLNEVSPDDASFVSSPSDPTGDSFEVKLDPLAWPQTGPGAAETLKVRLRQTGGGAAIPVSVLLMQGGAVIEARNYTPTAAFAEYDMTLTDAEVAAITNYTDLRVRVYAGWPATPCCPGVTIGPAVYAHFINATGDCACLAGLVVPLTPNSGGAGGNQLGADFTSPCNGIMDNLILSCDGPAFSDWTLSTGAGGFTFDVDASTCTPLSLLFHPLSAPFCNNNALSFDVLILSTP